MGQHPADIRDPEVLGERNGIEDDTHLLLDARPARLRELLARDPEERRQASVDGDQPQKGLDGCRLPCTVRADEADYLPRIHRKVHALEREPRIPLDQSLRFNEAKGSA